VNTTQTKVVYSGGLVVGLEVDQFRHYLFIADLGNKTVKVIDNSNASGAIGETLTLYSNLTTMQNMKDLVIDRVDKIIFWGNSENGSTQGAVVSAPYTVDTKKIYRLSNLTGISALDYDNDDQYLYYALTNGTLLTHKISDNSTTLINSGNFTNVTSLDTLDDFVYVVDNTKGLYYIRYNETSKTYASPKKVYMPMEIANLQHIYFIAMAASFLKWAIIALVSMLMLYLL
jgi:hypothetical protein